MHISVLDKEIIEYFELDKNRTIVDATVGLGGHTRIILEYCDNFKVIGIDQDKDALNYASRNLINYRDRVILKHGNFSNLASLVKKPVDGVLFDLGVSSMQLDNKERGFSFNKEAKLDMRMNREQELTAKKVINSYPASKLVEIIKEYGEERWANKIAERIVQTRKLDSIETTKELADIVRSTIPKKFWPKNIEPATKTFQAIRIEVNQELDNLKEGLDQALKILKPRGRVVVISFHSLEDRIVKNKFKYWAKDCICPPDYPICKCDKEKEVKILTKKPIRANQEEIENNPRARSAKLRACEKI